MMKTVADAGGDEGGGADGDDGCNEGGDRGGDGNGSSAVTTSIDNLQSADNRVLSRAAITWYYHVMLSRGINARNTRVLTIRL